MLEDGLLLLSLEDRKSSKGVHTCTHTVLRGISTHRQVAHTLLMQRGRFPDSLGGYDDMPKLQ